MSQSPLSATQAMDWLIYRMSKGVDKFQDSKGQIGNKLINLVKQLQDDDRQTIEEKQKKFTDLGYGASLIHIYFKDLGVIRYQREESYGIIDLIGRRIIFSDIQVIYTLITQLM